MPLSKRQQYLRRWASLKAERQPWITRWRDLSDHILPWRSRFLQADRNKPRSNNKIINNTPTRAALITSAGLMSGASSPTRPWYRFALPDPSVQLSPAAKRWLFQVENLIREVFNRSNIYNALQTAYRDLVVFGMTAIHIEEDESSILTADVYPIGQYALAASASGRVDTVYRECSMTVGQLVEKFGLDACSRETRRAYDRGEVDTWRDVLHIVEPNRDYREGLAGPAGMRYRSCWLEMACGDDEGFLREGGYEEMPTLCPRWDATGEDVYGHGPGDVALPDCKGLQFVMRRKAGVYDKTVDPPMVGPASMRGQATSLLPGALNYEDLAGAGHGFRPAVQMPPQAIGAARDDVADHEQRIMAGFHADLWLLAAQAEKGMTAREVAERSEEKMMQLGPPLERLHAELFRPLIDRAFGIAARRGLIPPPPEELAGLELKVEFISILAQAQKALGVVSIDRLAGFVGGIAQMDPEVLDNVDRDEAVRAYADALGTPPQLLKPAEQVERERQARRQAQQQQAMLEQAQQAAAGARDLSQASIQPDNALGQLLGVYGAQPPAQGVEIA